MQVRGAAPEDAAGIAAVYAPYVTSGVASFEEQPPDAAEMARRIGRRPRLPWLVADDGGIVGFAYASLHRSRAAYRWAADCSVYVHADQHGRGVGRALYDALLPAVRDLGYVTLHAGIVLPNDGSVALHERLGFRPVGTYPHVGYKLGGWHDVQWWQLALREPPDPPAEPREWAQPG